MLVFCGCEVDPICASFFVDVRWIQSALVFCGCEVDPICASFLWM